MPANDEKSEIDQYGPLNILLILAVYFNYSQLYQPISNKYEAHYVSNDINETFTGDLSLAFL